MEKLFGYLDATFVKLEKLAMVDVRVGKDSEYLRVTRGRRTPMGGFEKQTGWWLDA